MDDFKQSQTGRIVFLDNLRYFFVLCVVLEHACNAYRGMDWWPVADPGVSLPIQMLSAFFDSYTMPLLFFISGYFALPSIRKWGGAIFFKRKLRRLGIPWTVCILTICPMVALVYHYTRHDFSLPQSFASIWLDVMGNALKPDVGLVPSMNQLMMENGFYQRYMWFLSLLLAFFMVFSLLYHWKKGWFDRSFDDLEASRQGVWPTLKLFFSVSLLTLVLSFTAVAMIMILGPKGVGPEPLLNLGNILQFRPSRFFFFLIYFCLGILVYRNQWIKRGKWPGHLPTWGGLFALLLPTFLGVIYGFHRGPEDWNAILGPLYFFVLNFLAMAILGFLSSLAYKYWNRPTEFDHNMAAHSYNTYLGHYVFVIGLQLVFLSMPSVPSIIKFLVISLAAMFFSYQTSKWLLQPRPKTSLCIIIFAFLVLVLFT